MPTLIRYRWRYIDPFREKVVETKHWATEHDIKVAHPDASPVEGTRQVLEVPQDVSINSMARFGGFSK